MSISMILLIILSLCILFGALQRVLDRMALTDRQALICTAAIFIGGFLPDLILGPVTLNIGGGLIPLCVCAYLFVHADMANERIRCIVASFLTAAAIYAVSLFFPSDPNAMPFDPTILYGLSGGLIAWLLGRSRRGAFIAGVLGILIADIITAISVWRSGVNQALHLGSAGAQDTVVIAGVSAVLLCELFGETMERIKTGKKTCSSPKNAMQGGHHS